MDASLEVQRRGPVALLRLHGRFDGSSAWSLRNAMESSACDAFIVDLGAVDEFNEFGAAVLAAGIAPFDRRVRVQGVTAEEARLLSSFGVERVLVRGSLVRGGVRPALPPVANDPSAVLQPA
ncbi:MAG TPA: hypothetical protein VFE30_09930 [Anaeromyxobacteraceae bacterium]|nr:hypothetical protein [Anaeromyxobacteraceae bacterium]